MDKKVTLEALDVNNWLKVCDLSVSDEQKAFFPIPNVYWIGISRYEEKSELFAIKADNEYVGLIGGGYCRGCENDKGENDTGWINPLMIDYRHQRNGYGRQATKSMIKYLLENLRVTKIELGHRKVNTVAGYLYESLGFRIFDDEGDGYGRKLDLS